jgi:hypothetical protein
MVKTLQDDSVGTIFRQALKDVDGAALDLTGATTLQFRFQKPDQTVMVRTATVYGLATAGTIQYVGLTGEFGTPGAWKYQARVILPSGEWFAPAADFEILPNLEP